MHNRIIKDKVICSLIREVDVGHYKEEYVKTKILEL